MARYNPDHEVGSIYDQVAEWRDTCLLNDDAILSSERQVWTEQNLDALRSAFVGSPDEGSDNFLTKLHRQLSGQPDVVIQLAAELLWAMLLFPSNVGAGAKRNTIREVLSWRATPSEVDQNRVTDEVLSGIGSSGQGFNTNRPREFGYFIDLVLYLKRQPRPERDRTLAEPWTFATFLTTVPAAGNPQLAHIIEHLLFPDAFERISGGEEKRRVLAGLSDADPAMLKQLDRVGRDRRLAELRGSIQVEEGHPNFDFYEPKFSSRWKPAPAPEDVNPPAVAQSKRALPIKKREQEFENAIADLPGISRDAKISKGFGNSNSARVIDGGCFVGGPNYAVYSKIVASGSQAERVQFVVLCRIALPPYDEVYFAIVVDDDWERMSRGLRKLYFEEEKTGADKPNNNVKCYITKDGRLYFHSRGFLDSLESGKLDQDCLVDIDRIYFSIWPPASSIGRSHMAREFVGWLGEMVGHDGVHEIKVWSTGSTVDPAMQRSPDKIPIAEIEEIIASNGGYYPGGEIRHLHAGLNFLPNKHFVILTGVSGCGKTQLAVRYACAVHGVRGRGAEDPFLFTVAVRPEWTDPTGLTGYNDVLSGKYVVPTFLEAVLVATANPSSPIFVILDEMNLARVEYYFSDVLSAMEIPGGQLNLHSENIAIEGTNGVGVISRIPLPPNLYLIGTINIDESTNPVSDKVLDRAVVVDMSSVDLAGFLESLSDQEPDLAASIAICGDKLVAVHTLMTGNGLGFGYRVGREAIRYHAFASRTLGQGDDEILDGLMVEKVLIKLRGSEKQRPLLMGLTKEVSGLQKAEKLLKRLAEDLDDFGSFQASR